MASRFSRSGFTLLEIIITVAILAILTGISMPLASKAFESKARTATRREAADIAEAVQRYVHDTLEFPGSVLDLTMAPDGVAGWTGPYLPYTTDDPLSGESDWTVDAWSRPYQIDVRDDVWSIASGGPDRTVGTPDDIVFEVDATPMRRERTLDQLAVLNQAVSVYNATHLPDDPLPTTWPLLLEALVDSGALPTTAGYTVDAWGDAFRPDPPGRSPVVKVGSVHIGLSSAAAEKDTGTGKNKRRWRSDWDDRNRGERRDTKKRRKEEEHESKHSKKRGRNRKH